MTVMKDNEKLHNLLIEQQKQMGNNDSANGK